MNDHLMTDLETPYQAAAVYLEDADSVEYLRRDVPRVYRRVDSFLTLVLDMKTRELSGFRLEGFRNFFLKHPRLSAIEQILQIVGDDITSDLDRKNAYRQAQLMAHEDSVAIKPLAA